MGWAEEREVEVFEAEENIYVTLELRPRNAEKISATRGFQFRAFQTEEARTNLGSLRNRKSCGCIA